MKRRNTNSKISYNELNTQSLDKTSENSYSNLETQTQQELASVVEGNTNQSLKPIYENIE